MTDLDMQGQNSEPFNPETCGFAVYGTQGGGLVRWDETAKDYVFVEVPEDFPEIKLGECMHPDWGLGGPVNDLARDAMLTDDNTDGFADIDPAGLPGYM